MTEISLTILPETEADAPAIDRLHERTFGPGRLPRPLIVCARKYNTASSFLLPRVSAPC